MIDIQFRECCQACQNIDVSYDQARGFGEVVTVVGCTHACVCGAYNSEGSDGVSYNIVVKGFDNAD